MKLFDPTYIRNNVDYSFGDQSGESLPDGYMKNANINNLEFMLKYNEIKQSKPIMTLFIDNIRLYKRPGIKYTSRELTDDYSKHFKDVRVNELNLNNDLLDLCSKLTDIKFLIFTSFEDTPIDEEIFEKIPENVIGIYSSNSTVFGDKVHPMPYGLQRKLSDFDERQDIILEFLNKEILPTNLLYINHNVSTNIKRIEINEYFKNKSWVTVDTPTSIGRPDYTNYLSKIKNHKFMICPEGNAIGCDCHRDWEVIYMRRVPIVIDSDYLRTIFKGIPVLFVKNFTDITEELLIENESLFNEIQNFDFNQLDVEQYYKQILKNHNI
jgi:hypothetical protein